MAAKKEKKESDMPLKKYKFPPLRRKERNEKKRSGRKGKGKISTGDFGGIWRA